MVSFLLEPVRECSRQVENKSHGSLLPGRILELAVEP